MATLEWVVVEPGANISMPPTVVLVTFAPAANNFLTILTSPLLRLPQVRAAHKGVPPK